ncbi:uncharacterized protein LOC135207347 [Macrobrachium nipponense]|uniref:uncharacterized protein LOC135207347 n=1 Tax=Macrobrachium nipponense TaxID=159736 RepID=UPI0030C836D0
MPDVPFLGKAVVHMIKLPTITRESNWVDRWCNTGVERKFMDMFPIIIHSAKHYYNDIESLRDHQVPTRDQPELQWLNMILLGFWPSVKDYIEGLVSDHMHDLDPRFHIRRMDLGYPGLEVASVDFRRQYVGGEIRAFLDVKVMYNGGCSSRIQWNPGFEFEVSNIMVQAVLNIELMNFVGFPPFVQKVVVHMEKDPIIDAEFSDIAYFNITPIKKYVMYFIRRKVKSYFPITQHLDSGLRF